MRGRPDEDRVARLVAAAMLAACGRPTNAIDEHIARSTAGALAALPRLRHEREEAAHTGCWRLRRTSRWLLRLNRRHALALLQIHSPAEQVAAVRALHAALAAPTLQAVGHSIKKPNGSGSPRND